MDISKAVDLASKALAGGPKPAPEARAGNGSCIEIVYPNLAAYSARTSKDMLALEGVKDLLVLGSEVDEPPRPDHPDAAKMPRIVRVFLVL